MHLDLEQVYELSASAHTDAAIDLVFDAIDDALFAGEFAEVDALLARVDVSRLDSHVTCGFLTITSAAAEHLPARPDFAQRAQKRLEELGRWTEQIERWFVRLKT